MFLGDIDDIERLRRINKALMARVESATDQQGNAFSLFQTAINLEGQVKRRTDELSNALRRVERTNIELELAKETAEQANLAKTRFLAAASHDVLQPLNAALLSISVLADLQTSDQGKTLVSHLERSLETMSELLGTLIDISRLDAGVMKPQITELPLEILFEDLRTDFMPLAENKGLDFRFRSSPVRVKSDRAMLRRILQNLLSNALRYTSTGGVLVAARARGEDVLVEVIDTGWGIPADQYDAIFEEFNRGALTDTDETEPGAGLGLGLSIVQRMVIALGHDLQLRSRKGVGTRFTLKLPLASPQKSAGIRQAAPAPTKFSTLTGARVLLIENDLSVQKSMIALLESWRCTVAAASNIGDAAGILSAEGWKPALIIADQHLDRDDLGTQAVETIRAQTGLEIPALIVTADPDDLLEEKTRSGGMELMHKPVKPAQLRALISHMLKP